MTFAGLGAKPGQVGGVDHGAPAAVVWAQHAACVGLDPDVMFPADAGGVAAAKAVCAVCPVVALCLADALDRGERFGVWGGTSERERARLRRQRVRPCDWCGQPMRLTVTAVRDALGRLVEPAADANRRYCEGGDCSELAERSRARDGMRRTRAGRLNP